MAAPVLVLGGGNALGAYHAGVWAAFEAADVTPSRIIGTSIGAVMAALIVGNAPEDRGAALRRFWQRASEFDLAGALPAAFRKPFQYAHALSSRMLGRPPLFTMRMPDLTGTDPRPGQFDAGPMRELLASLLDIHRLNDGAIGLTAVAVDLVRGAEVVFDSRERPIELDHIMASAALIPDFPPVEIGGRLLVDGGLAANCAIHLALDEAWRVNPGERLSCFAADLFAPAAPAPRGILQGAQRQSDLIFAMQTAQCIAGRCLAWQGREPGADLFYRAYQAMEEETALKGFDFSAGTLARRQEAGQRDMAAAITQWQSRREASPGLTVHWAD